MQTASFFRARRTHRYATRLLGLALLLVPASPAVAQAPAEQSLGRITGRVIDAATGQGIPGAQVQISGTTIGAISGVDGRYVIPRAPADTVGLTVRRIGYGGKEVTGVVVPIGGSVQQDISLGKADITLDVVTVTATAERGTVAEALDAQKNATNVVNSITAEQIARSPDSDAAQAAQRVSGVSVQDGKYLQVRGLGERYTTASLNGARIPSPEPERKVVPLDLFPASLLQDVTTQKTFTPDQPGDFAGANVNIRTREFPQGRQTAYSLGFGVNDGVMGTRLPFAPRAGGELFGFASDSRALPTAIGNANFRDNISQAQYNDMARQQRNVWSPVYRSGRPNGSIGASTGGNRILGYPIGYLLSGTYGYTEEVRRNERYAVGNQGANNTVVPLTTVAGSTGRNSVQWGGIANLSAMISEHSRLSLNTTMTRTADNEARVDRGFDENLSDSIVRTTLRYVERGVATVTGQGEHQLNDRNRSEWLVTYARTSRREPDRSDIVYARTTGGDYQLLSSLDGARRLYFSLDEDNLTAQFDHTLNIGAVSSQNSIKVGAYARSTERVADAPIYAFLTRANESVVTQRPEIVFGSAQACDTCTSIFVQPIGQSGSYTASDQTFAGYLMSDWGLSSRIRLIAGARVEHANIMVNTTTQGGFTAAADLDDVDVLPSVLLNTRLSDKMNLRLGLTRTLARPEYRELAPVTFRDVLGGVSITGNDKLRRSLIDNLDVRFEHFSHQGEVISIGVFAKRFQAPIERVEQATSGAYQARFQNAESATNIGVEIEARKHLAFLGAWAEALTGFGNVTLMRSSVSLDTVGLTVTDSKRRLVGQAPYVVNGGVTYSSVSGAATATLLYNVVGERIYAAGVNPLPNIVERPRHVLDLSLRFPLIGAMSGRLDARNLFDARHRFTQGNLEREGYNVGRTFSMGLSWRQ